LRYGRYAPWPLGRNGSAIPMTTPKPDLVLETGKLWERHVAICPLCESAVPGCTLGAAMYAVYELAATQEGR